VAFDPLDGSSIVGANFAVGSIFGIWKGTTPLNQKGRDQVAAIYSIYGPRTLLVVAIPSTPLAAAAADGTCTAGSNSTAPLQVMQYSCTGSQWHLLQQTPVKLKSKATVAPANLRAAAENAAYKKLMDSWISSGCKLRYSGGMVPDVHHILAKVGKSSNLV
jgi:fructose-1,6-bisphosphatase